MNNVLEKLQEIKEGKVGMEVFSNQAQTKILSLNREMVVPLASSAKVAIGFCITKWVEEKLFSWDDAVENISFNPNEDSKELYPHFQHRSTLALRDAVEVMIACHDSLVASRLVDFCGGWDKVNHTIQSFFPSIFVTVNPRDERNQGQLNELLELMVSLFKAYQNRPFLWLPLMNGLVRQQGSVEGIVAFHLNHMTGGLENVIVNIGIIGEFHENPFVYALGAIDLPNRTHNQEADHKICEAMKLLYLESLDGCTSRP
ncbi:hypothetical protein FIU87_13175 [Bacillus sp. THAF10]|uniref:serine hydrolase n=1 Tax=Bacillus sp. THAF10 TaxID=2587848 RepID=UPI001267DEC7|nr:serine hydrolase [Bacillus sp. THAF10]QFT89606.1 hypothetical protein FIU87_13175 [Bacillus sp. THAF10]